MTVSGTTVLRCAGGVLLLFMAPVVGLGAAVAAVLGVAPWVADTAALGGVGLVVVLGAATPLVAAGAAVWRLPHRRAVTAGVVVALAAALAAATGVVLEPPEPAQTPAGRSDLPPGWRTWDLGTGSRIAYAHATPTGSSGVSPEPVLPPVVFLHGGPGTPGAGLPAVTADLTAAGFDVYTYDQLGSGSSSRLGDPAGYTVDRHVADLEAVRAAIGADRLVLVGQSWGASLAAAYLARHPGRVAAVAFTAPGPLWAGDPQAHDGGEPWDRLTAAQRDRAAAAVSTPRMLAASLLLRRAPRAAHALVGDEEADEAMREAALVAKDATMCPGESSGTPHDRRLGFYVNQVTSADAAALPDPRPALRRLDLPVLVLRGACDFVARRVAVDYARTFRGSVLVDVPGAGHALARGAPDIYREQLLAFARAVAAGARDGRAPAPAH